MKISLFLFSKWGLRPWCPAAPHNPSVEQWWQVAMLSDIETMKRIADMGSQVPECAPEPHVASVRSRPCQQAWAWTCGPLQADRTQTMCQDCHIDRSRHFHLLEFGEEQNSSAPWDSREWWDGGRRVCAFEKAFLTWSISTQNV
jgi:hypothetical protein